MNNKQKFLHSMWALKRLAILLLGFPLILTSCKSNSTTAPTPPSAAYSVHYLTANASTYGASSIDKSLVNPWGLCFDATNSFLYSANNGTWIVNRYDSTTGAPTGGAAIPIPQFNGGLDGVPSGIVLGPTNHPFIIPNRGAAGLIISTEDGTVSAWNPSLNASQVVINRNTNGAVYKGITVAGISTSNTLWLANFHVGQLEVYDQNFALQKTYTAPSTMLPASGGTFGPFDVATIGGVIYTTYAREKVPDAGGSVDDSAGAGMGAVVKFDQSGNPTAFASGGTLNSPWGIAQAPSNFGKYAGDILIGNFGDGRINVYNTSGAYQGQLEDSTGAVISIPGLWALVASPQPTSTRIYFSAGPNGENDGTLGYIDVKK